MEHYVNIMLDGGFKAVFGDKQVAMDFINAALEGEHKVMDITYLDKELVPELIDERTVIFDLLCEDEDGSKFILEMQNCPQRYFFNRGFYYICRMISRQGETGRDWKYELLPVYGIYLLNFSLPEFPLWRTDVVLANELTGETFGRIKLKQVYISFERFDLSYEECETPLEKTIYVLKNMNLFDMSPFKEKEAYFRRLLDVANVNALSPKERATYDENLKIYRDWKATMEYAVEEAETKGKAEGERLATLRNARNMKKAGVDLSLIAECTELSLEIIQSL
ncbi:Rpn family recombination-promoting nuclease/putative transposase [Parabacteroides distasonis]|nr:Rpn family recombination-promoting nuclease/putative transposase [Parabacteroides distasonis]